MRFVGASKPSSSENQFFITENVEGGEQRGVIQEERSQESEDEEAAAEEGDFDFGRAKLDFFKSRAREILLTEQDCEYEGPPQGLGACYKQLKAALKNPVIVPHTGSDQKPGYLKTTFSVMRSAVDGDRFLEISRL